MDYWVLREKPGENQFWAESYSAQKGLDFEYDKGKPIECRKSAARINLSKSSRYPADYLSGILSFPVISQRLKVTLESNFSDPCEFHNVRLYDFTETRLELEFYFMNVLDNRKCFDWKKSEYEKGMNNLMPLDVTRLVLVKSNIRDRNIVRMAEIPSLIIVSDKFRSKIKSESLSGMEFASISSYNEFDF